jgi:hypothetical protein
VFSLFWLLIVVHLEIDYTDDYTRLYFICALIGAAGAGELSSEIDYTDDYTADDYSHAGVHARLIMNTY